MADVAAGWEGVFFGCEGDVGVGGVVVWVEVLDLALFGVLAGVGGFVLEHLDEFVESGSEEGAEDWTNPVDPMVL